MKQTLKTSLFGSVIVLFTLTGQAHMRPYSENELAKLQAQNQRVVIQFHADWCPTCRKQKKSITEINTDSKFADIHFLEANYDSEKQLKDKFSVRGQSTLIYLQGNSEKGRSQGVGDKAQISAEIEKHLLTQKTE